MCRKNKKLSLSRRQLKVLKWQKINFQTIKIKEIKFNGWK